MGLESVTRPGGIKGQCLSSRSRFLFLRQALSSSCAGVHQSPRAVAFMNSEGRFRRLFRVEQRRIPLRCLLSDFRDKFCSLGSLTHRPSPPGIYVSHLCLGSSSFVGEFSLTQHVALVGRDIHERRALPWCCEQQVSRASWIVGGHPPFVPRVTSSPALSLHFTPEYWV